MLALVLVCDPEESFLVFFSNAGLQRHGAQQMCADPGPQLKIVSGYYGLCNKIIMHLFINAFKNIYILRILSDSIFLCMFF